MRSESTSAFGQPNDINPILLLSDTATPGSMAIKAKVYSYLRFSDPKQAAGSSADRQMEYARCWAAERGMTLDSELSMQDAGLSAYHQRHITRGALGLFLQAIDDARIPAGSVLVVEGLDRLSRAEPIQAEAQLAQIINAGITVVTASDGREYNREGLKAQPMDLVYSLLVMIRAHEESDTKSKRVRAAIHRQCQGWMAGTWHGLVRNGKDPHWLRLVDQHFEIAPERGEAVRIAVSMFREGHGAVRIMRTLADRGLQITNGGNPSQQLYRIVRNRALIGEKVLEVDGQEYRLAGYYPPLLSPAEFADLQHLTAQRSRRKGTGEIPGLITGMRIAFCGYCGAAMVAQNLMTRGRREDGRPQDGHRRLICVSNSQGGGCPVAGSCSVVPIEHALVTFCADQMNLSRLLDFGNRADGIVGQLTVARVQVSDTATRIDKITDALLASDAGQAPAAFMRRARELEAELAEQQKRVEALEHELAAVALSPEPAAAKAWACLVAGVEALDYDARIKARQLVADTFDRIVVFHRGRKPERTRSWKGTIDLLLIAKRGGARLLHIDRQTGGWQAGEQIDTTQIPLPPKIAD
ncbi:recombinase family protein [Xanthomonas arboricola]|uniref:recombinase family protein n=4 Tax=Xanthomonas arboricola TaxID=56448 RepID=UPI000584531A|nr:recombinase family protein [Xanthomonas arboricola]AKU48985.1 integrase [Xanthomonas arboricola pv. juglandis]KOB16044.1 integrase [Xanthomonas arboricola]KOB22289.1 integrase [Xanthomonas arboricola]KOB29221.1 integrase [Xanthomonas arboricola]KOB37243.1 integrase [Xanthomonas arboricola]